MFVTAIVIGTLMGLMGSAQEATPSIEKIIQSYVQDFRSDRFAAQPMLFGIRVPDEGEWHVRVTGEQSEERWGVELVKGPAPKPTFVYRVEAKTLRAIDQGKINALTAQGKSFGDDYAPMDVLHMDGFEPSFAEYGAINPFSFHFWTRGFPEVIPFGEGMTRRAHGSNFVVFYYQPGLRTAWYRVEPGERVRDDPQEQAAPFPMMAIVVRGKSVGEVDGQRVTVTAGQAVFIPASVQHRWWNDTEEAAELILIMFGENA